MNSFAQGGSGFLISISTKIDLMRFARTKLLVTIAAFAVAFLNGIVDVQGATFDITYDDTDDGVIGGTIVGTGTFSFDGSATLGEFALDTLTNLQYSAVVDGVAFNTADILTDLGLSNLLIFDQSGQTLATFTGDGGLAANGSFDLLAPGGEVLTHEPGPTGAPCCGGTDTARLYASLDASSELSSFGNFQMVLTIPEPSSLLLGVLGLIALDAWRKMVWQTLLV